MTTLWKTQDEMHKDLSPCLQLTPTLSVTNPSLLKEKIIDLLIYNAVFSEDDSIKAQARAYIYTLSSLQGCSSQSIFPLYRAFGQGNLSGFTIPAVNIRTLTYDTARLIFRLMMKHAIAAVVFEIARSEIEYTHQRPEEYAVSVLAAAIKEGYRGPVYLQGDHFQFSRSKFETDMDSEIDRLKNLIKESITAQFFNIDIDASTLVDLSQNSVLHQQKNNYEMTALLSDYIRSLQPKDHTISIGGEIGHIGGKNSTIEDFSAFMKGYSTHVSKDGLSKISVQTGSSHGGTVLPDGSIQKVSIDFSVLEDITKVAREQYHMGGAVQHGASTLPLSYFDSFPKAQTLEIHLATGLQNIVYETIPQDLHKEINTWLLDNLQEEREEGWNNEQFLYKTRKKAFGPFKQLLWELSPEEKAPVVHALEKQLSTIFEKLNIFTTKEKVTPYVS